MTAVDRLIKLGFVAAAPQPAAGPAPPAAMPAGVPAPDPAGALAAAAPVPPGGPAAMAPPAGPVPAPEPAPSPPAGLAPDPNTGQPPAGVLPIPQPANPPRPRSSRDARQETVLLSALEQYLKTQTGPAAKVAFLGAAGRLAGRVLAPAARHAGTTAAAVGTAGDAYQGYKRDGWAGAASAGAEGAAATLAGSGRFMGRVNRLPGGKLLDRGFAAARGQYIGGVVGQGADLAAGATGAGEALGLRDGQLADYGRLAGGVRGLAKGTGAAAPPSVGPPAAGLWARTPAAVKGQMAVTGAGLAGAGVIAHQSQQAARSAVADAGRMIDSKVDAVESRGRQVMADGLGAASDLVGGHTDRILGAVDARLNPLLDRISRYESMAGSLSPGNVLGSLAAGGSGLLQAVLAYLARAFGARQPAAGGGDGGAAASRQAG